METYKDLIKGQVKRKEKLIKRFEPRLIQEAEKEETARIEEQRVMSNETAEAKIRCTAAPNGWLRITLKKTGIQMEEMQIEFLANMVDQFKRYEAQQGSTKQSVNYMLFLFEYFQKVSEEDWPDKYKIIIKLARWLPKSRKSNTKARFEKWWNACSADFF